MRKKKISFRHPGTWWLFIHAPWCLISDHHSHCTDCNNLCWLSIKQRRKRPQWLGRGSRMRLDLGISFLSAFLQLSQLSGILHLLLFWKTIRVIHSVLSQCRPMYFLSASPIHDTNNQHMHLIFNIRGKTIDKCRNAIHLIFPIRENWPKTHSISAC